MIPRDSRLKTHDVEYEPGKRLACRFRTCYPVGLWPIGVRGAKFQPPPFPANFQPPDGTQAVLRLQLECQSELPFSDLSLQFLRFFLYGEDPLIANLYELLFNHVTQVVYRPVDNDSRAAPIVLKPHECLRQVGYERDEGMLPYPNQSFVGYRLLSEFFAFPQKFLFLDLGGWPRVRKGGFQRKLEVLLYLNRTSTMVEQGVTANTFRTGCTPIINLFEQTAEPIRLTQLRYEYPIVPDVAYRFGEEVYAVHSVYSTEPSGKERVYQPFYSFRHGVSREPPLTFWYASRRRSLYKDDRGTEVFLNLVDLDFNPCLPADSVLTVTTTCMNRDLPTLLQQAGEELAFDLERTAPLVSIQCVRSPTKTLRPPLRRGAYWRLLSHLNLNHLSLSDPEQGRQALQELLRLYDFSDPEAGEQRAAVTSNLIDGILSVSHRRVVGRTGGPVSSGFARCRSDHRIRRAEIRRRRQLPFRLRAGAFSGTLRFDQLLQPTDREDQAG